MQLGLPCRWDLTGGECNELDGNLCGLISSSDMGNHLDLPTCHLVRRIWWVLYVSNPITFYNYEPVLITNFHKVTRRVVFACRVRKCETYSRRWNRNDPTYARGLVTGAGCRASL